jgi:hypothetical protein
MAMLNIEKYLDNKKVGLPEILSPAQTLILLI